MPDVIRLLPDVLANQIAAGEVVQRPASAVKEMLENSVDAGASQIQLIIGQAGKSLIQVVDDGTGMSATDARMCFERHATSKIEKTDDLFAIRTFGFRGEAMASIAAVAQVELKTRRAADELGTRLYIEGNQLKAEEPIQHEAGTSISVKNLFFNTPARRKFLKSDSVEFRHIVEEFQRVALARPEIAMSLIHNGEEVFQLPSGKLARRIVSLFGKNYQKHLIACSEEVSHVSLQGYIGRPDIAKKTRSEQFLFVNKRFVKHGYLHHAITSAYAGLLAEGQQPFYTLFLEMDPGLLDINVHPTKTEVKFEDERTLYGLTQAAVRQALGVHQVNAPLDFELDVNFSHLKTSGQPKGESASGYRSPEAQRPGRGKNLRNWERLYNTETEGYEGKSFAEQFLDSAANEDSQTTMTFSSAANERGSEEDTTAGKAQPQVGKRWVFQIEDTYIASPVRSGILLINQQAAHERILYERFLRNLENGQGLSQQLLFPATFTPNKADLSLLASLERELRAMGFVFEQTESGEVRLSGVPSDLPKLTSEVSLLEELLEQYKQHQEALAAPQYPALAQELACRAAIRNGQTLETEEMKKIIDLLFGCQNPNYSPSGERTHTFVDGALIASLF